MEKRDWETKTGDIERPGEEDARDGQWSCSKLTKIYTYIPKETYLLIMNMNICILHVIFFLRKI